MRETAVVTITTYEHAREAFRQKALRQGLYDEGEVVMADVLVNLGQPGVVAEEYRQQDGGPSQGDIVAVVRDDAERAAAISTVDDLGGPSGRLATVLAEADLSRGVVGHYGYGAGAQGPMPEWPETP